LGKQKTYNLKLNLLPSTLNLKPDCLQHIFLILVVIVITVIPVSKAFSQDNTYRFDKITSENIKIEKGLSVNSVNCILQDTKGYMWFGTWDGLNKFDGYTFTVYKADEVEKDNGLSNQTIHALFQDKEGNIWIGTEEGLNKFERNKQTFTQYKHIPALKQV